MGTSLIDKVKKLSQDQLSKIIATRRHIHAHPELSFQEFETAKLVADKLRSYDIEVKEGVATTGVTGLIQGKDPDSKVIALRADMDALPIQESNTADYRSQNEGVMHACGHDVHTSSLLGTARILSQLRDEFKGSIKLIFQPGEEKVPGGASLMIKDGVLENPRPANILGQHVAPFIPTGKVGFREGMYMASADEIYITVKGRGGHAATPEYTIDPILIGSHIVVALQQVISRNANPKQPSVLSIGKFVGDGATNIIPDRVFIEGTFRAMDEKWRADAHKKIKKLAHSVSEGMGGSCEVKILKGYPYLQNHPQLTQRTRKRAEEYMGKENVVDLDLWMAAEDFAFYTLKLDACFYRLGVRNEEKGIISNVHTSTFDIDENALEIGPGLMAWLALNELNN